MAEFGKQIEWAYSEATRKLLADPGVQYLANLPGHAEINKQFAEANNVTRTSGSTGAPPSDAGHGDASTGDGEK